MGARSCARQTMSATHSDVSVAATFEDAAARTGLVVRHFTVAGTGITMRFAGDRIRAYLERSFRHLASAAPVEPTLTVNLWDSESSRTEPPPMLGELIDADESGPMHYYEQDGVQAMGRWRTLSVLDRNDGQAWFWSPAVTAMASWDWAAPLRGILHWWLGQHAVLQVHGGAVGTTEGGVLVVGRGGSGKSTTALSCLAAGLRYAGDDFVAITTRPEPTVHSLYCSGKLDAEHLERFPRLQHAVANPVRRPGEKAIVYVDRAFPGSPVQGFPLRAVLIPRVVAGEPESRLSPVPSSAALAALAPSTIFQLYPPQATALAEMAALVRSVPCFSLELGSDIDRIPEAIVSLLGESA